jgi:hypothetical protein
MEILLLGHIPVIRVKKFSESKSGIGLGNMVTNTNFHRLPSVIPIFLLCHFFIGTFLREEKLTCLHILSQHVNKNSEKKIKSTSKSFNFVKGTCFSPNSVQHTDKKR